MHRISITRLGSAAALGLLLILGSVAQAQTFRRQTQPSRPAAQAAQAQAADPSAPQACQARLLALAQSQNWRHQMKGNVLYLNVPSSGREAYLNACGPNVIEFWKEPRNGHTYHHLYTRLGDTNWSRIWSLSQHDWYVPGGEGGIGVLGALDPSVVERTKQFLQDNARSLTDPNNRFGTIGQFNVSGGGGGPNGTSHCTNYWSCARVGDRGENMPQLFGQYGTGIAPGWISSLMRSGNQRVFAVAVYGDNVADFSDSSLRKFFE